MCRVLVGRLLARAMHVDAWQVTQQSWAWGQICCTSLTTVSLQDQCGRDMPLMTWRATEDR